MLERIRFAVPHSMRPDLRPLEPGLPLCDWAPDSAQACAEKFERFQTWSRAQNPREQAVCFMDNADPQAAIEHALPRLIAGLGHCELRANGEEGGYLFSVQFGNTPWLTLERTPGGVWRAVGGNPSLAAAVNECSSNWRLWWALGFCLHEDLVMLRRNPAHTDGILTECMHVSFPSGWSPFEKIAASFEEVHAPVADGELLRKAAPAIGRTMLERGPFERFVWTISPTGERARFPGAQSAPLRPSAPLWFRFERQITLPLTPSSRALFLIRVYVLPLDEVFSDSLRKQSILQSLNSMTPEVLHYKGLTGIQCLLKTRP